MGILFTHYARPHTEFLTVPFPVDLQRPRDVAEIKLDPRFMDLYRNIWSSLRSEVEKSYERHD
ncbi:hypothetical protein GCM10007881_26470 [Mesorhizobium huakuii]|nr:hypothetical protein GCM10007881_26470 [Mesorhizobium huakuii]